jgi:hypothetical protein
MSPWTENVTGFGIDSGRDVADDNLFSPGGSDRLR